MATVSIFNITNISTTRALTFSSASEREAWFDNYADTPFDIAEIKDINALQQQIPLTSENDEDLIKHMARITQGDNVRYYFITNYRRLNRSQVLLTLKLDTITSFMLYDDAPLVFSNKSLILREHRDRFATGAAVYDQTPEDVTGEMLLDSVSTISGSDRLHCLLKNIVGDDSGSVALRPYWFPYIGTTPSLISQSTATGLQFYITAELLVNSGGAYDTICLMFHGQTTINGIVRTPAANNFVYVLAKLVGSEYHIYTGESPDTNTNVMNVAFDTTNQTALIVVDDSVESRLIGVNWSSAPTFYVNWHNGTSLAIAGYTLPTTAIDLYDGSISKYVILPYTPLATSNWVGNSIMVINSLTDNTQNYPIFSMTEFDRSYATSVSLPSSSYTFTTSGTKTPLRNIFEFTITSGRPDTEIGTKCKVTLTRAMPSPPIEIVIDLPDSTAMSIEELRDFIAAELDFTTSFIVTTLSTNKLQIASSVYGAEDFDGGAFLNFDFGTASDASGTGTRIQTGVLATTRIPLNDPKLYTSQFYLPVVSLNGNAIPLYRELIPSATTTLAVNLVYGSNLEDVSVKVGDATNFKSMNEGIRLVQLSNRAPLYATEGSTYYQYLKEYDDRLFNIQQTAIARNATFSAVNQALSAVVPMIGNETPSVGITSTRIARAGFNVAQDVFNAVDQYQGNEIKRKKAMLELSLSNIDIASSSVEFLIANDLDKIQFSVSTIKDELQSYLDDLFYYQGYATLEIKAPDVSSRVNFNYLKGLIDISRSDMSIVVSDEIILDISERFKNGVTIFHINGDYIDWDQVNENWED